MISKKRRKGKEKNEDKDKRPKGQGQGAKRITIELKVKREREEAKRAKRELKGMQPLDLALIRALDPAELERMAQIVNALIAHSKDD